MTALMKFDFDGKSHSFDGQGWFNATEAAKRFGKEPFDWLSQLDTVEYACIFVEVRDFNSDFVREFIKIKELKSASYRSRQLLVRLIKKTGLVKTKIGSPETGGGTWIHPDLAVLFARWLDMRFSVWCDQRIKEIIRTQSAPTAIQNLMQLLLKSSASEWELRFPDEYYKALARITGTTYTGHNGGTPAVFGQITLNWVYGVILPRDVLSELKRRRDGSAKMHQWLTDGGEQALDQQIAAVTTLAKSAVDYKDFLSRCTQVFNRQGQVMIVYPA
jgi:hypothetical protein